MKYFLVGSTTLITDLLEEELIKYSKKFISPINYKKEFQNKSKWTAYSFLKFPIQKAFDI